MVYIVRLESEHNYSKIFFTKLYNDPLNKDSIVGVTSGGFHIGFNINNIVSLWYKK